jgi:uncharacterized membrane protein (DUF4010 family)
VALGAGLLIGIERERRKGSGPQRALAGVRTFTLAACCGALTQALGQPILVLLGALLIVLLNSVAYWRSRHDDPGITTELALFFTYLIGITAMLQPVVAAGLAAALAILLASRNYLHGFSLQVLSNAELRDALVFAGAVLIVLPLLPDQPQSWLAGVNLRRLWMLAVVFMLLETAGYIALRVAGPRLGLALSGLASGFVSSTATIATLGSRARHDTHLLPACIAGALFSCIATVVQMSLVIAAVHLPLLPHLLPHLMLGLLSALMVVALSLRRQQSSADQLPQTSRVFNLWHAVGFALLMSLTTASLAVANARFGQLAVTIGVTLGGFFDAHAAAASVFSLIANGTHPANNAALPMLLALSSNTVSKLGVAFISGGATFGFRVGAGLLTILTALWLPLFFVS